jgi:hypothetical protein
MPRRPSYGLSSEPLNLPACCLNESPRPTPLANWPYQLPASASREAWSTSRPFA